jgi:DNA primase
LPPEQERGRPQQVWVPSGIVIPWYVDGAIWRIFLRRRLSVRQLKQGAPKYIQLPGGTNALYNADSLRPGQPAMLVEGAFDALAVQQEAGDLVTAVASGTTGARRLRWIGALSLCRPVLLSFDSDAGGQEACAYWQALLGEIARPWWPTQDDPAAMLAAGQDLRAWVLEGIQHMASRSI